MASTLFNLDINAGQDWTAEIDITSSNGAPRDLTGMTFISKIKRHYKSISHKTAITITVLDEVLGKLRLQLSNSQTTALKDGKFIYDIELTTTATGAVERIVEGIITIQPEITTP